MLRHGVLWGGLVVGVVVAALAGCNVPFFRREVSSASNATAAPFCEGVDSQGRSHRLADHAGKVVLLSFWYGGCPPCRRLFPHEMELVQKYRDRPFVLLGISADETPEELRRVEEKAKLLWPSLCDGGFGGPICKAWGVEAFPTLALVDARGMVRWRCTGVPADGELERQIEELLAEVDAK